MPVIVELARERFEVRTPNLLGSIVAKSAAVTEVVSASRLDKEKLERDLATLLMCAARDSKLDQCAEATTEKDRKRLTAARRAFHDDAHPCWSDGADRSDLETVLAVLLGQLDRVARPGHRDARTAMLGGTQASVKAELGTPTDSALVMCGSARTEDARLTDPELSDRSARALRP